MLVIANRRSLLVVYITLSLPTVSFHCPINLGPHSEKQFLGFLVDIFVLLGMHLWTKTNSNRIFAVDLACIKARVINNSS